MRLIYITLVGTCLLAATVPVKADMTLGNIMPLGDSITAGVSGESPGYVPGGYRQELYNNLTASGYSFNFVGSSTLYSSDTLTATGNDHHEGHGGYTIQQIIDGVVQSNWLDVNPDIILLHIGANDMVSIVDSTLTLKSTADSAPNRLDTLLGVIFARKPDVQIIIAEIIGGSTDARFANSEIYDDAVADYNTAIAQKVANRAAFGQNVSLVDMYSLMNYSRQTNELGQPLFSDLAHPNQTGYDLMGDAWASAIKAQDVPEPSTLVLLISGFFCYVWRKRKSY